MNVRLLLGFACCFLCWDFTCSYKILGLFPMVSYSHFNLGFRLMKGLAERGHDVTLISPFPQKTAIKNLRDVPLTGFVEIAEEMIKDVNMFNRINMPSFMNLVFLGALGQIVTNLTYAHENVQKLLHSNETFDVVIMEQFINDGMHGIAYHLKAPTVLFCSVGSTSWTNRVVGNPDSPSYIPRLFTTFSPHMTFLERTQNSLFALFDYLYNHLYFLPKQNQILHEYLPDAPHLYDLMKNTSLVLLNSHVSFAQPVPHVPNMIEIGGYHVSPTEELPSDLKTILDDAKHGVIYFSMGSNLKSKDMSEEKRNGILKALSKLKMTVLWKWEDETLPGQPSNVVIKKWLPQEAILAHPNVKLFITHGGMLSTIESLYYGQPVVGIPVYGDQMINMVTAVNNGYGISIPFTELSESTLSAALEEILTNPKYSHNAKTRSQIMRDQPIKPMDSAVYWIEYVIKHKGAHHLRSAAVDLSWYQYLLLDVAIFSIVSFLIACKLLHCTFKLLVKRLRKTEKPKKKYE